MSQGHVDVCVVAETQATLSIKLWPDITSCLLICIAGNTACKAGIQSEAFVLGHARNLVFPQQDTTRRKGRYEMQNGNGKEMRMPFANTRRSKT